MISESTYKFFSDLIFSISGMKYDENDYYRLEGRINTLLKECECDSETALVDLFKNNMTDKMRTILINTSTNNETFFFRDKNPFAYLNDTFLPALQAAGQSSVRIWSAACSFGQEPFSIAMLIKKNFPVFFENLSIDATDISEKALEKCRSGIYSKLEIQRGLPIQLLTSNFEKLSEKEWKIKPDLQSKVHFSSFNLMSDSYPQDKYDLIFCRNVLIYQTSENKEIILNKIYQSLRKNGVLVMGAGESLLGMKTDFNQDSSGATVVYRKN